jgi:hypothetical protein
MTRSSLRRALAASLVAAALLVPCAAFATPTGGSAAQTPQLLPQIWSFLVHLWHDAGCGGHLSGRCGVPPPEANAGCIVDPDGRCRTPLPTPDEGCIIDPNGGCKPIR